MSILGSGCSSSAESPIRQQRWQPLPRHLTAQAPQTPRRRGSFASSGLPRSPGWPHHSTSGSAPLASNLAWMSVHAYSPGLSAASARCVCHQASSWSPPILTVDLSEPRARGEPPCYRQSPRYDHPAARSQQPKQPRSRSPRLLSCGSHGRRTPQSFGGRKRSGADEAKRHDELSARALCRWHDPPRLQYWRRPPVAIARGQQVTTRSWVRIGWLLPSRWSVTLCGLLGPRRWVRDAKRLERHLCCRTLRAFDTPLPFTRPHLSGHSITFDCALCLKDTLVRRPVFSDYLVRRRELAAGMAMLLKEAFVCRQRNTDSAQTDQRTHGH